MIALAQRDRYTGIMRNDGKFKKGQTPWNKGITGYMGANRTSFKKGDNSRPLTERFWEKVKKYESCWEWIGSKNNTGYGRINVEGKVLLAHRVSYSLNREPIEKKIVIMHICDNSLCVRPDHLRKGTQLENMQDMDNKGRRVKGDKASWSKLNSDQANQIRNLYAHGGVSMRALGKQFNISYTVINHIIHNKLWK